MSDLCLFHESDEITNFSEAQSRGGQANRRNIVDLESVPLNLDHPVEFHAFVEAFLRMQLAGSVPAAVAVRILRTIRILQTSLPSLKAGPPEVSDRYDASLDTFIEACDHIGERLGDLHAFERAEKIA